MTLGIMCAGTSSVIAAATDVRIDIGVIGADQRRQHVRFSVDHGGDRRVDMRHPLERRLDLAEFDPVATDLDPMIDAADELQCPVGLVADEIACPIPGSTVVLDELLGGQVRPPAITAGDAAPGEPQFARYPIRAVGSVGGHHAARVVRERRAVRHRRPVRRRVVDLADRAVHRGFGRAAEARRPHSRR